MSLKVLEILIIRQLHLVTQVDDAGEVFLIVYLVVYGILDATVEIDCQNTL